MLVVLLDDTAKLAIAMQAEGMTGAVVLSGIPAPDSAEEWLGSALAASRLVDPLSAVQVRHVAGGGFA